MSSTSFPASEDLVLVSNEPECAQLRSAKSIRSAAASLLGIGPESLATMTSEHSQVNALLQMELFLTLSAEDSPARTSPSLAKVPGLKVSEAVYGSITPASSESSSH